LDSIDFTEEILSAPFWEVFDGAQISDLLKSCEKKSLLGERAIDVQMLHIILNEELASLQGASAIGQRQMIQQEIKK
jgi:hypothetical protein